MKNVMKHTVCLIICLIISLQLSATVNVQVNADGTRFTGVQVKGSTTAKYDIVFVGDGFTSSSADQTKFNNAVSNALTAIKNKSPYKENICAFNVWRVNVISPQTGIDHPISGITKNTELNCTFGDNVSTPERVIYSTAPEKVTEAANFAPAHDAIYVLVNDLEYGGASGDIVYTSLESRMQEVVVHELGHFVGRLADEYTCYFCDGRVEPPYSGPEPSQANVTIETNRALIKWRSLINAATPLPTTVNSPVGVVGLWQGGMYSPTGVYRPQQDCLMQALYFELCAVCNKALAGILAPYCTACEKDPSGLACMLSRLKFRFYILDPRVFKIPTCCFCPLGPDFDKAEIVLSINPELYDIQVLAGGNSPVQASISATREGGTSISFQEAANTSYFLSIAPRDKAAAKAVTVRATLARNGRQSVLF